jgi:hypothetical protein
VRGEMSPFVEMLRRSASTASGNWRECWIGSN